MTYGIVIAVLILALLATVIAVVVQSGAEPEPEFDELVDAEFVDESSTEASPTGVDLEESYHGLDEIRPTDSAAVVSVDDPTEYPESTHADEEGQSIAQSPSTTEELFDRTVVSEEPSAADSQDVEEMSTSHAEGITVVSEEADRDPGTVRVRATRRRRVADGSGDVR